MCARTPPSIRPPLITLAKGSSWAMAEFVHPTPFFKSRKEAGRFLDGLTQSLASFLLTKVNDREGRRLHCQTLMTNPPISTPTPCFFCHESSQVAFYESKDQRILWLCPTHWRRLAEEMSATLEDAKIIEAADFTH